MTQRTEVLVPPIPEKTLEEYEAQLRAAPARPYDTLKRLQRAARLERAKAELPHRVRQRLP